MDKRCVSMDKERKDSEKYHKQMLLAYIIGPMIMNLVFTFLFFSSRFTTGIRFPEDTVSLVAYIFLVVFISTIFAFIIRWECRRYRADQKYPIVGGDPPVLLTNNDGIVRICDHTRIIIEEGAVEFTADPDKNDWFSTNHEKLLVDNRRYNFLYLKTSGKVTIYSSRYSIENNSDYTIIGY